MLTIYFVLKFVKQQVKSILFIIFVRYFAFISKGFRQSCLLLRPFFSDDFFFNIESYLYFCEQKRIRVYATVSVVVLAEHAFGGVGR